MKLIFVSAPYTADGSRSGIEDNIARAEAISISLINEGWSVITPPKNTAHYERYEPLLQGKGYKFWLEFYIEILRRCDAIIMCSGWKDSTGCKGEYKYAMENGITIFFEEDGIPSPENSNLAEPISIKEAAERARKFQASLSDDLIDADLGSGL